MTENDHRRREHDCRQRLLVQQPGADVGRHRIPHARQPGASAPRARTVDDDNERGRRGQRDDDERHGRAHGRRQDEQDGDRQHGLHDLSGGALPGDGP